MVERLRPAEKPPFISDEEWEASECKLSPTGSHYFKLSGKPVDGPCIYCHRMHSVVHPERRKKT